MKLIDKDTLLTEIEKLKEMYCYDTKTNASFVAKAVINSINNAINSIEVKEVDIEKELDSMITPELKFHKALPSLFDVAKHFFELGLKASNPLTWKDIVMIDKLLIGLGITFPCKSTPDYYQEVLERFKDLKERK